MRKRREERQLSRERLARLADVSTATVVRIELNNRLPNVAALARITAQLGLSIDELVQLTPGGAA